jgi:imidazolonepropionase-like amidohydrolase
MKNIVAILLISIVVSLHAQIPAPGEKQTKSILLLNGYAHLGNGKVIENSAIGFKDGKLVLVADARTIKINQQTYDTIINIEGKHVYPGIIAPNSTLGLVEIEAVRATRDFAETGTFKPNVRSIVAYNTDSRITPTVRSNGVLIAQITPRYGFISGTSSIVQLDAWNWEDAALKTDDGIHMNWMNMYRKNGWWAEKGGISENKNYQEQYDKVYKYFEEAKAYAGEVNYLEKNLEFEAMRGLFDGTKTLYIHADFSKEIEEAIAFKKYFNIPNVVLVGGYESYLLTDQLKENNIPVMLRRIHSLPEYDDDAVDLPFTLPKKLWDAGVLFCLENSGDMEAMQTRNLPFYAGTAAAYGLDKDDALQLVTLNTAKILGIDSFTGSIEPGKDATLFVSEGDALDMETNNVILAFIQGRKVNLDNPQKYLYRKFKDKK